MRKIMILFIAILLTTSILIPLDTVSACSGTGCRGQNPGQCADSAYTVYGGYAPTGTNGRVFNELRYSVSCISNWSRGTIWESNQGTLYLYVRIKEVPNPNWVYTNHYGGYRLPVGFSLYTNMVSGTVTTSSFAGISSVEWFGPYDPTSEYSG